jgi:hypothetical protein
MYVRVQLQLAARERENDHDVYREEIGPLDEHGFSSIAKVIGTNPEGVKLGGDEIIADHEVPADSAIESWIASDF